MEVIEFYPKKRRFTEIRFRRSVGEACVLVDEDGNLYIDRNGKVYLFDDASSDDGWNICVKKSGKYNVINPWNKTFTSPNAWFNYIGDYDENLLKVLIDDRPFYIDADGILYNMNKKRLPDGMQVNLKKK